MKTPGKTNKLLVGKQPHERYHNELHGDSANPGISQFIGYAALLVKLEAGSGHEKKLAQICWDKDVLPLLERELRQALAMADGSVFVAIGEHLSRFRKPVDPLRAWICERWSSAVFRDGGWTTVHEHADKTSSELFTMFRHECPKQRIGFNEFCRALREFGVLWKKSKGGAPLKKKLRHKR